METESKYLKQIRDELKKKNGDTGHSLYNDSNAKAKYLRDIHFHIVRVLPALIKKYSLIVTIRNISLFQRLVGRRMPNSHLKWLLRIMIN